MIKALVQRFEDSLDFRKVPDPACIGINLAGQVNADTKRMPMQTPALVPFWNVRQTVCRLEGKLFEDFHCVLAPEKWRSLTR